MAPTFLQVVFDGIDDVVEEQDWFQQVDDCQSSIQYTTMLIIFVICIECIRNRNSLHLIHVEMYKTICGHFRDRKRLLVEKLPALIAECSRSRGST